jgi:DNA-binding CsgD family transcriptional regulator
MVMVENKGKKTSLFLGTVTLIAYLVSVIGTLAGGRVSIWQYVLNFYSLSILGLSFVFYLGYFIKPLIWIQPIVFFALTPIPLSQDNSSFYSLGFFVIAVLLLVRFDFMDRHRAPKLVACIVYLIACEIFTWFRSSQNLSSGLASAFFVLAFLLFLFTAFNDRIVVYLKEPKEKVSLEDRGLADAEQLYVLAVISGKSIKEVSFENGVSESTVRNTLSRAYKKLGLHNKSELSTFAERYEVVQ